MADWIDIDKKLEKEHQKKIIGLNVINNPEHYHGKTLELQDVFKDFFGTKTFIANCCMNIIKYAIRLDKKDTVLNNALKIKKYAQMIIDAEEEKR